VAGDFNADGRDDLAVGNSQPPSVTVLVSGPGATAALFEDMADGVWYFHVRAVDVLGATGPTVTRAARIDTRGPRTRAPYEASVRRYGVATLRFKAVDPRPGSPTAKATIRVRNRAGVTVTTLRCAAGPVNTLRSRKFTCNLPRGRYRFWVYAADAAGNVQVSVGSNTLTVR
jgi:hypothetical protein